MISSVLLIFLIVTIVGIVLLRSSTNENRFFVLLPAGMIWGVSVYIFLLNLNSKFLPGPSGIILSTFFLISLGIICHFFIRTKKIQIEIPDLVSLIIIIGLILTSIYLSRLKMTSVLPVADNNMQWAYAASFARGNYPIKAPWQPDLNPSYHLGTYFLEGAILSLSKLPIITIHTILNTYLLTAGSLLAIFIFWEAKYSFKNLWLIIAALVIYISFGVIIIVFPTQDFFASINNYSEIFLSLTKFPDNIPAKGEAGASLVDLNSLSFLPARSLSLGLAFLTLYFAFVQFKNNQIKVVSLVLLFSVTALVEESMFLPLFGVLFSVFILSFFSFIPKLNYLKAQQKIAFLIILFTSILVILQGGFISELLSQSNSSFRISLPFLDPSFTQKLGMLNNYPLISDSKLYNWFFPSPLWFVLIILIYSFITKKSALGLLGLYSLIAYLCFLMTEYRYSPSTNIRFYSFGNITSGAGLIYLIFFMMRSKKLLQHSLVVIIICIFILVPSLLPEMLVQSQQINEARSKNIRSQVLITSNSKTPFEQISDWAGKNLPLNSRLIVLATDYPTPTRSLQFQYKGLYTILGPQYIHTNRPEPGTEFFDLSLTLNPTLLRQTKTGYIYIESESLVYKQLPQSRKDELLNGKFFETLQSIDAKDTTGEIFFRIYKVKPEFLDSTIGGKDQEEGTLVTLQRLLPKKATIYIADYGDPPKLNFWYRMAVILALKDRDIRRNLSQTDYQVIETDITYKVGLIDKEYDFYILGPNQKPPYPSTLIWSNILATGWKRIIYNVSHDNSHLYILGLYNCRVNYFEISYK